MWRVHWHHWGALSRTSSSPPSPTESNQFPDNLLASPLRLLGMDLLAVHIWLSSLLWSMVIIFPYQWGSDGTTCMPLISFSRWRSPPMGSKVIQDLNLKRVDLQFSFASSVSLHFLLGILSSSIVLHPAVSLNHCSLQVDKVFPPPDFHSLLSPAGSVFTISFLKHRMSWSKPLSQTNVPRRNLCRCAAWRPVGIPPAASGPVLMASQRLGEALAHSLICTRPRDAFTQVVPELST